MSPSSPPRALPVAPTEPSAVSQPAGRLSAGGEQPRPLPESTRSARDIRVQFEQLVDGRSGGRSPRTPGFASDKSSSSGSRTPTLRDRFASVFRHRRQDSDTTLRAVSINEDTPMTPVTTDKLLRHGERSPVQDEVIRQTEWMLAHFPSLEKIEKNVRMALNRIAGPYSESEERYVAALFAALFRQLPEWEMSYGAPPVELMFESQIDLRQVRITDTPIDFERTPFMVEWTSARMSAKAILEQKRVDRGDRPKKKKKKSTANVVLNAAKRGKARAATITASFRKMRVTKRSSGRASPVERPGFIKAIGSSVLVPARGSLDTMDDSSPSTSSGVPYGPYRPDVGLTVQYRAPNADMPFRTVAGLFEGKVFRLEKCSPDSRAIAFEEKKRWRTQRLGLAQGISYCLINKQQGGLGLGMVGVSESFARLVAISDTTVLVEVHPSLAAQFQGVDCNITALFPENLGERMLAHSFLSEKWDRRGDIKSSDLNIDALKRFRDFWLRCLELVPKVVGPNGPRSFSAIPADLLSDVNCLPVHCARSEDIYRLYEILRRRPVGPPAECQPRHFLPPPEPDELDPDDSCSLAEVRENEEPAVQAYEELASSTKFRIRPITPAMMDEVLRLIGSCAVKCGRKLCCHQSQEEGYEELAQDTIP